MDKGQIKNFFWKWKWITIPILVVLCAGMACIFYQLDKAIYDECSGDVKDTVCSLYVKGAPTYHPGPSGFEFWGWYRSYISIEGFGFLPNIIMIFGILMCDWHGARLETRSQIRKQGSPPFPGRKDRSQQGKGTAGNGVSGGSMRRNLCT